MTLLKSRFNYEPISRSTVDGRRLYTTPTGDRVPSVTTVLSATTPKDKQEGLEEWRRNVGHERAKQITTQAANRGTKMHTFLENYVATGEWPTRPSNPFHHASYVMAETVINQGLSKVSEVWGIEIPLYMPQMYAGTADGVGIHQGEEAILDYKQSNKPKKEEYIDDYKLQIAAYALAHNEVHGTDIRKGVILMCVKPKTNADGLIVVENNTPNAPQYQEFVIEGEKFDYWCEQWWLRLEQYYLGV